MEISLNKLLKLLLQKLWLIVLIALIGGLCSYAVSEFFITPKYQSQTDFLVIKKDTQGVPAEVQYEKNMVPNYVAYIRSKIFLNDICDILNQETGGVVYTAEQLQKMIKLNTTTIDATIVVEIIADDPQEAFRISKAFADFSQQFTKDMFVYTELLTLNPPALDMVAISPNVLGNTMLGFILGLMLSLVLIILIERMDNTVKGESDITDNYNIPLIGVVYTHKTKNISEGASK